MDSSTALAIASLCGQLLEVCIQSYNIFANVQNYDTDYGDFCSNLDSERERLMNWVKDWGISGDEGGLQRGLNPEAWEYRYAVGTLARISAHFTNLKNLGSMYGVHVDKHVQQCSSPSPSPVAKSKTNLPRRTSRWVKSFLGDIKHLEFSRKTKCLVTYPQQTSTSDSSSRTASPSPPTPEDMPGVDIDIIAHLENPIRMETKDLLPNLAHEITSLSNAATELHKILLSYTKFRWVISDKGKSKQLVQQLTKYNDRLYDIHPPPPPDTAASSMKSESLHPPPPSNPVAGGMGSEPFPAARNQHYVVPHISTSMFTGRSSILQQIHRHFLRQASSDATRQQRRFVLFGMHGFGKTQIALKFAEDYRDCFWAILWIDASSREAAENSFCDIARIAGAVPEETPEGAKRWLANLEEEWLLIIDNADDPTLDFSQYFPSGNRGNILLTTRNRNYRKHAPDSHFEVQGMEEDDAITLVLTSSKTLPSEDALQCAALIVRELGFHTLAIDQAGKFISNSCKIDQYLDIYKARRKELLLRMSIQGAGNYRWTAYTTWELLFRRVEDENPTAADILQLFAFLHHEGISEEIFHQAGIALREPSTSETQFHNIRSTYPVTAMPVRLVRLLQEGSDKDWDLFRFRNDVETLLRYSLVLREKKVYSVHPLVHVWARDRLEKHKQQPFVRFAAYLLAHAVTRKFELQDLVYRRQLLPHIHACRMHSANLSVTYEPDSKQAIYIAINFGLIYSESRRWKEAEASQIQAVEGIMRILGDEHPDTLTAMEDLSVTYYNQRRWQEVEKIEVHLVEVRKRILGDEHPDTLESMENLSLIYRSQDKWKEAEKLEAHVAGARERSLGMEDPTTMHSMAYLAMTYANLGRLEEAEKLEGRVLEARERVLGKEHPDTLISMGNLAATYVKQGRFEEAEQIQVRVMELSKRILGKEHPDTLTSMANLATTYGNQGRYDEAEKIEVRLVEVKERNLGKEHPDTMDSIASLAITYGRQGLWKEEEKLEERIVETGERILGKEHPDTVNFMGNLAATYGKQGRWKEAQKLQELVVKAREIIMGKQHPDTLISKEDLATMYEKQDKWKEAVEIEEGLVEASKRNLGKEHPHTLTFMANLAIAYGKQGRLVKARKMGELVVDARERILSKEHPDTLFAMGNLALTYGKQGLLEEKNKIEKRIVEASERISGKEHPNTLKFLGSLASTYESLGRLEEAEKLQESVLQAQERILGKEHPDTLDSMGSLAITYEKQGRLEEAEKLGERVVNARENILGKEHSDTLTSMSNLALTYMRQGRLKEAEKLQELILESTERIFGKEHPDTLTYMGNLATTYSNQGRYEEAEKIEEYVVDAREKILGKWHPDTLFSLGNLATTIANQRRYEEAEEIEVLVFKGRERVLGKKHPDTLAALGNLAQTYRSLGRTEKAKEFEAHVAKARQYL